MLTRLLLVRHGQSEDNVHGRLAGVTDSRLTPLGIEQAGRMARFVTNTYRVSTLYASPLTRTRQTAEFVAELAGVPIGLREDLRELHFGDAEGLTLPEVAARFPNEWQRSQDEDDLDFCFPGGEPRRTFHDRIRRALGDLIRSHPGQTVAVVSHGGVLSSLLADLAEGKPQRWRSYYADNCALSELVLDDGTLQIVRRNVSEFLK